MTLERMKMLKNLQDLMVILNKIMMDCTLN